MEPNEKHIDDLFRQEMEGFRETPPDAVWESLEQRLDAHVATGKSPGAGGMGGWLWVVLTFAVVTVAIFGYRQLHKDNIAIQDKQVAFSENVPSANTTTEDGADALPGTGPASAPAVAENTVPDGNGTEQPLFEEAAPAGPATPVKSALQPVNTPGKQAPAKQSDIQASQSADKAATESRAGTAKLPAAPGINAASTVPGKVTAGQNASVDKAAPGAAERTKADAATFAPDKAKKGTREAISPSPATGDKHAVRETVASSSIKVTDSAVRDGNATRPAGIRSRTDNAAVAQKETRQASSAVKDSAARELTRNGKTVARATVESPFVKTKEQATPHKTAEMGSGIAATSDKAVVGANKEAIQATVSAFASKDAKAPTVNGKSPKQKAVADSSTVAERQLLSSAGNKAGGNVWQSKSAVVTPEKSAVTATKKDRTTASVTPDAAAKSESGPAEKIAGRKTQAMDKAVTEDSSRINMRTATADAKKAERLGAQSEEKRPAAIRKAAKQNSKPQASVGMGALAGGAGTKPKPGFVAADKAKRSAAKPGGALATRELHEAAVWLSYVGTYRDFRADRPSAGLLTGSAFPQPEPSVTKSGKRKKKKGDLSTAKVTPQGGSSLQSGKSATDAKQNNTATAAAAAGNTLKQPEPGNKTAKDNHTAGSAGTSGAALAAAGSSAPRTPRGFAFQAGILGGVEKGFARFSAQKTALSAFFEWTVGAKWGIGVSPAYKWSATSKEYSLSDGSYVSPGTTDVTVFDQARDSFGTYTGYGSYAFAQKYDSMVATRQLQRNYREFELPLWVSYHLTKNWTVLAGVQLTWGSIPVFQGSVQTFTGLSLTDTVRNYYDTAYIGPAAPDKFAHKGVDSFSSYKSPSSDAVLKPVRGGYILGLRYTHRYGISAEATIRQNLSGLSGVSDPTLKQLMSQPYIRISIGYQIGRSGKSGK
ncbi:MAG: hypothetical protein QM743_02555 [Chitinophagaceae bacterium]